MHDGAELLTPTEAGAWSAAGVSALVVYECARDALRVAMPQPETQLVVRFGPTTRAGLDIHALGVRQQVHRKFIRSGQRVVMARLQLGASESVLGVPASGLAGRIVALDELWGAAATEQLTQRLAATRTTAEAAVVLETAMAERRASNSGRHTATQLALRAAPQLTHASVNAVALDLGVSERHLRRVFRETVGVSPKAFTRLMRFHRALRAARSSKPASWANIAAAAGYYDQAHLIAEFRDIAGVTPCVLLNELSADPFPA